MSTFPNLYIVKDVESGNLTGLKCYSTEPRAAMAIGNLGNKTWNQENTEKISLKM